MDLLPLSEVREIDDEDSDSEWDAPARIDWRQFHADVLTDEDMWKKKKRKSSTLLQWTVNTPIPPSLFGQKDPPSIYLYPNIF